MGNVSSFFDGWEGMARACSGPEVQAQSDLSVRTAAVLRCRPSGSRGAAGAFGHLRAARALHKRPACIVPP